MAKYSRSGRTNWDRRDGLKIHRILDNGLVSRYAHSMSLWDVDNVVVDNPDGSFHHVSVAKELRRLNPYKCRKINGYNGKLNGRR